MSMETKTHANATLKLWDMARSNLTEEDLDWFSGLTDEADMQAHNLPPS
jgi:hypothetical protein